MNIRTQLLNEDSKAQIDAVEIVLYSETLELVTKFTNKTAYYNMETLVIKPNKLDFMKYEDSFLSFGYTPQFNLLDYLNNISDYGKD